MKSLVSMARKRAEWWYDRQSPKVKGKGARLRGGVSTVQKAAPLLKDMEFLSTSHRSASHRRRVCGCGWADPRCIFVALLTLHNQGEACAPPLLPAFEVLKFLTLTFVACIQHRRQKGNTGPTNSYHGTPGSINPLVLRSTRTLASSSPLRGLSSFESWQTFPNVLNKLHNNLTPPFRLVTLLDRREMWITR